MDLSEVDDLTSALSKRYRLLTELGEGGMARVYLAMVHGLAGFNKLVVLKILKRELARVPELREGFLREARLSARMGHPNVVAVNEVEEHAGTPVIIMEYLQGQTLSAIQRRMEYRLPLEIHLRILSDSLSGLEYAHELSDFDGAKLQLVHRDFTPQNVFVTYDGSVKVLDFGIAQATRRQSPSRKEIIKGKLRYMSPEQISGAPLDRRTDVFAAGVMLCEAATGQRFWGDLTEKEVIERVTTGKIPTPKSLEPSCPDELDRICNKALAFDRQHRYATVAELQGEIETFAASQLRRVGAQELGRQLAVWFDDERKQAQQLIEARLSDENFASCSYISVIPPEFTKSNTPPIALTTPASPPVTDSQYGSPATNRRGRRLLKWLGQTLGVAAAVLAAVVLIRGQLGRRAPLDSQMQLEAGVVKTSTVRITALPASAGLFIDDLPVAPNPFIQEVVADDSWHRVRAQAPGYRTLEQRYQANRDIELVMSLEEEKPTASALPTTTALVAGAPTASVAVPKGVSVKTAVASPRTPSPRAQAKVSCSPPYTFDQRGLKRFKPECM